MTLADRGRLVASVLQYLNKCIGPAGKCASVIPKAMRTGIASCQNTGAVGHTNRGSGVKLIEQ
ncbi:hypothetical protein ADIMK_1865 [Marinobacterium lacunae]|uniref:Uncharacterized protein n=1 Tax=Marinobacterium lacunae TaxID=1232683 RepID=A0A081G025_9GAMM|nr:hypothetical protein ADIMK_1865 [Marinobacterium lacunae]